MPDCEPDQGSGASGPAGHSRAATRPGEQGGLWRAGAEWPPLMLIVTVMLEWEGGGGSLVMTGMGLLFT